MKFLERGVIRRKRLKRVKKYRNATPRPSKKEFELLYKDIGNKGQLEEIDIDSKDHIIDGYSRDESLELWQNAHITYNRWEFVSESEKFEFILSKNLARRHLNTWQKILTTLPILEEEKRKATKRQKTGKPQHPKDAKGKAVRLPAKIAGVSTTTYERALFINENADEKIKKKLDSSDAQIKTIYSQMTRKTRNLPKAKMPKGKFDVILCDVPIGFDDQGGRGAAENHYSTMTPGELIRMEIPTPKNAIIFFWMSPSIMYDTTLEEVSAEDDKGKIYKVMIDIPIYKAILDAWGFKLVKGEFSWNKEKIGVGSWNRNQHENCLIGIKGTMPTPAELFSSVISEKRTIHSKKPLSFYGMIEKMYPKRHYLELFAKKRRKGWKTFGDEVK